VACERDLSSGIQDTYPLPVYGVLNERPHGPCLDTMVQLDHVEKALRMFLKTPPAATMDRKFLAIRTPSGPGAAYETSASSAGSGSSLNSGGSENSGDHGTSSAFEASDTRTSDTASRAARH
jgi:hypothetical protein